MLIEALVMLIGAAAPQKTPAALTTPAALFSLSPAPAYQPDRRAVDNWPIESALALDMGPLAAAKRALGAEQNDPARCVKLNNYWCIKSAGWNGEIAADADGHVAFASAEEGAAVAAVLLRRYYVDYNRRSALAIVERWAPSQCSPMMGRPMATAPVSRAGMTRMLPQRVVPMGLAPRGLQNTLRARWLASHRRGGLRAGRIKRSRFVDAPDLSTTPSIMEGVTELPSPRQKAMARPAPRKVLADPMTALAPDAPASPALQAAFPPLGGMVVDCSGELARIANYASAIAAGVVANPGDDLMLFDAAGAPTDNLAKVMQNMAAVEIGPARPRPGLVTAAVAQLRRLLAAPATAPPNSNR